MKLTLCTLAFAALASAQDAPLPSGSVNFNLPKDSPVALRSMSSDQSRTTARGAAVVLDLHMTLALQNTSAGRIHGVSLRVISQEVALGGRGSVTMMNLNVGPGEVFPVRIDTQLVRPAQLAGGPLVTVDLDGVLFQNLNFYGPDRLNSRRTMTACAIEAQRDREYFKRVLLQSGAKGLQQEILDSMTRQAERSRSSLAVKIRRGPAVSSAALPPEHPAEFAFVQFPDAPVEAVAGWAQVSGNEARAPRIEVLNKSGRPVKYVELGWLVSDQNGKQYMAGSLPSSSPDLFLPAGQKGRILQDSTLNFSSNGQPVHVQGMTGFISQVEFADGKVWVPNRQNLQMPLLRKVLAPSAEEERLSDLYRRKGIDGLIEDLNKY